MYIFRFLDNPPQCQGPPTNSNLKVWLCHAPQAHRLAAAGSAWLEFWGDASHQVAPCFTPRSLYFKVRLRGTLLYCEFKGVYLSVCSPGLAHRSDWVEEGIKPGGYRCFWAKCCPSELPSLAVFLVGRRKFNHLSPWMVFLLHSQLAVRLRDLCWNCGIIGIISHVLCGSTTSQ